MKLARTCLRHSLQPSTNHTRTFTALSVNCTANKRSTTSACSLSCSVRPTRMLRLAYGVCGKMGRASLSALSVLSNNQLPRLAAGGTCMSARVPLSRITGKLGVPYSTLIQQPVYKALSGKIIETEPNVLRAFVNLPVTAHGRTIEAEFLLVTGTDKTRLAPSLIKALGASDVSVLENVRINGLLLDVGISDSSASVPDSTADYGSTLDPTLVGYNILGMDYLMRAGCGCE